MKYNILLVLLMFFVMGCGMHFVPDGPVYREYPDGSSERSTSFAMYSNKPEDSLERAKHLASKRQFEKAIQLYHAVYSDSTVKDEYREDALFHKGSLLANFFNEHKDYQQALDDLHLLLQKFPETEFRPRAEKKIDEIERILDRE